VIKDESSDSADDEMAYVKSSRYKWRRLNLKMLQAKWIRKSI